MSDSGIARHVGADHVTVANWRKKLEASCEVHKIATRTATRRGKSYQIDTAWIGKRRAKVILRWNAVLLLRPL
jgi:hypothetical protein